jgi:hypothetical protein
MLSAAQVVHTSSGLVAACFAQFRTEGLRRRTFACEALKWALKDATNQFNVRRMTLNVE